uniref:Fructose-bisphosphate aldolase n=1 Tax=Oryza meridionalis TaxID=40149 RepID=A0A0E0F9X1_9ORYZ
MSENNVMLEGILLKPSMVTPGAESKGIARGDARAGRRRVPLAVPGVMFLSGGQSEVEATRNLNAMNQAAPTANHPWRVSFSYARALQNTPASRRGAAGRRTSRRRRARCCCAPRRTRWRSSAGKPATARPPRPARMFGLLPSV